MASVEAGLAAEAERFAEDIADLIASTVSDDPPIRALARGTGLPRGIAYRLVARLG